MVRPVAPDAYFPVDVEGYADTMLDFLRTGDVSPAGYMTDGEAYIYVDHFTAFTYGESLDDLELEDVLWAFRFLHRDHELVCMGFEYQDGFLLTFGLPSLREARDRWDRLFGPENWTGPENWSYPPEEPSGPTEAKIIPWPLKPRGQRD